ncbi:hypothetical protein QJQ45_010344 [Haematococcus lacustris]|nr:hypothetical protein QJQ45_010344 [Haematococcus lacustris]
MAKLHIHPVGLILLLLGLASWVVALAGLAASTKFCNDNSSDTDLMSCTQTYQQDWWAVFFELILILVMLFTCFLNIFPKAQFIYMAYLVMVTGLLTFTTRKMFTNSFNRGWLAEDLDSKAYDAAAVGCMFCCIVNYGLIIFIGGHDIPMQLGPVPEDLGSDIEDRGEALQPDLTEAERNRKTSGEARAARAEPLGLHDQPVYTDIPVSQAVIPDLSCRNLYLQLCRGPPGNGANTQPNAAVAAVLAAHPNLRARLATIPRHPSDTNMVDHVGKQLETAFSNMLTLLFAGRLKKSVSLAGAKVLVGTEEHRRRFGFWGAEVQRLRDVEQSLMGTVDGLQGDLGDLQAAHQSLQGTTPELAVPAGAPPQQQQQLAAASTSRKRGAPAANKSRATKQGATHNSVAKRASAARLACGEIA